MLVPFLSAVAVLKRVWTGKRMRKGRRGGKRGITPFSRDPLLSLMLVNQQLSFLQKAFVLYGLTALETSLGGKKDEKREEERGGEREGLLATLVIPCFP